MGSRERREREKQELRAKILEKARDLFVTHGYEAVSMRKIADAIEYSPTAIYLHFQDKEALIHELCQQDFRGFADLFRTLGQIADPLERLRQCGIAYVRFGLTFPNHYRLMFMTPRPKLSPEEAANCGKGNPDEDAYTFLKITVEEAMRDGCFRPELRDSEIIVQTLWAAMHGIVSLRIAHPDDPWFRWRDASRAAELMGDSLMHGLIREDLRNHKPAHKPARKNGKKGKK